MATLSSELRKTLEKTVVKGRELAERGAREALSGLAVDVQEPFSTMGEEERRLRNRLRAHGRQLGDQRDVRKRTQSIDRLVREMAYEHWHRMLFARFLAENQLLIESTSGVAVTLEECEELAREEGTDLWALAARYAQGMLPQMFRVDDPVLAAKLPPEIRQQLQGLVADLEVEVFTASDSLGWTYQFWQTAAKKAVNNSSEKIGADELPAVTQLFTEDYMVDFLLDNTLGAWHAGKVLAADPKLAETAQSEEELRHTVSLPGCPWTYLRFIQVEGAQWSPAAGLFEGWPNKAAELKCLDPCMGSGHFVVGMFERLVALRQAEEQLDEADAVAAVIKDNLFGLEIDPRCTQIAAFNLALAAWRRVGHCQLPAMNLACSGLAPNSSKDDWLAIAGDNERLKNGMKHLYHSFEKAAVLGSLINPRASESNLLVAGFHDLQPLLDRVLVQETNDSATREMAVTVRGLAKAAEILADQFTLVATNVPYLGRRKQVEALKDYCGRFHPNAKQELATCFTERSLSLCASGGSAALLVPQKWLFLGTLKAFRRKLLNSALWNFISCLGPGAFETIAGEVVQVSLLILTDQSVNSNHIILGCNAIDKNTPAEKSEALVKSPLLQSLQRDQFQNPDTRIIIGERLRETDLSVYANAWQGIATSDYPRFSCRFWEFSKLMTGWDFIQSSVKNIESFGGRKDVLFWQKGNGVITEICQKGATFRGKSAWKNSALLSQDREASNAQFIQGKFLIKQLLYYLHLARMTSSHYGHTVNQKNTQNLFKN